MQVSEEREVLLLEGDRVGARSEPSEGWAGVTSAQTPVDSKGQWESSDWVGSVPLHQLQGMWRADPFTQAPLGKGLGPVRLHRRQWGLQSLVQPHGGGDIAHGRGKPVGGFTVNRSSTQCFRFTNRIRGFHFKPGYKMRHHQESGERPTTTPPDSGEKLSVSSSEIHPPPDIP